MPSKKDSTKPEAPKPDSEESALVTAAKAIGKAAGKVAALAGAEVTPPRTPKTPRIGKLVKKNKKRLPRREKKAQQKATATRIQ
jgi:hypothetical protein